MHFPTQISLSSGRFKQLVARGFTTIEIMVVIAILAILVALAGPSFGPMIDRWRVNQAIEGMNSTLYYARSEAIRRGGDVVIAKKPVGSDGCTVNSSAAENWSCGWFVFADLNKNDQADAQETLQTFATPAGIIIERNVAEPLIKFNRWGHITGSQLDFEVYPSHAKSAANSPASKKLCMNLAGRISTKSTNPGSSCS